jgi:hypothetical protein
MDDWNARQSHIDTGHRSIVWAGVYVTLSGVPIIFCLPEIDVILLSKSLLISNPRNFCTSPKSFALNDSESYLIPRT